MATGVKPRDDDIKLTRCDLETIQDAMKNKKFRDMFVEYCEEVRDPANQAIFQKEMIQLEKERGYDITFINPKGSYVIKTSVAGDRKAFINICSNDIVGKPSYTVQEVNGTKGMNWQIPYSLVPPRDDYDQNRQRCVIYDVVFHPDTLRMAEVNKQFRELVNKTAFEGLKESYNINLDSNNLRFPKSCYKGMTIPAVIRKEDPNFKPPEDEDTENISPEILEKLYPQKNYAEKPNEDVKKPLVDSRTKLKTKKSNEYIHSTEKGYTVPKYVLKQQKNVDFQEFTYSRDCKQYTAIPNQIVVEINLPLLSSTKDCILDVKERSLSLKSEKPAKYKLEIALPYSVNDECGSAKFDKTKHLLTVTLPVIRRDFSNLNKKCLKGDSGLESEENMSSQSDEDISNYPLVEELFSNPNTVHTPNIIATTNRTESEFLDPTFGYILPSHTHNVLDDVIAFTFHVKNTEPDSVQVKNSDNKIYIKFTSVSSGFVPVHYAAIIIFDEPVKFENINGEAWDNNVILQLEVIGEVPQKFQIGISNDSLNTEYFDMSQAKKSTKAQEQAANVCHKDILPPVVEVTNFGNETNIVVSSNHSDLDEDDMESPVFDEKEIVWTQSNSETAAKSILRKPMSKMRSYSESSVGDFASSIDYISSDCIPEESSLKKTVRFNDVIARQFYRYNSSIEGQKKKNQRKKSKKRNQDRRKSESEAEDDIGTLSQSSKPRLKSALKQRRDSGLADTSDAETDCKNTPDLYDRDNRNDSNNNSNEGKSIFNMINNNSNVNNEPDIWESETNRSKKVQNKSTPITCDNIKHSTDLYNPERLNKGKYLEVAFKNDLIFDLDM
ncbi:hypothetical protein K1T71_003839 [Dendrolimus kikuchii]|uniref:Uncharacterized protein n=1 Tax=Dendrolimus kikuchii TaxID=765133 RepID=A0ACC1D998_9NEOP|nr:hypothetical protein K1T71_003839 [Dendrolimus kikuchii]